MRALAAATREAVKKAGISGDQVEAIALDTTGSSVIPVGKDMQPLGEYYLWCDHRAKGEAAEITAAAHREKLEAIDWCGGVYSSEWGFSKLLHWLRHNPAKRSEFVSAFEHCDMVAATLCGITDPKKVKRSICAMGHKWLWNRALGGLPPEKFLVKVDPLLAGVREKLDGEYAASDQIAGTLSQVLGREAWPESRHSDSSGRIRRALGRDRSRLRHRRHGECGRDLHLHHRNHAVGKSCSRRLRRGAGKRASAAAPESKPDSPPWETSSMRSRPAPEPMSRR